MSWSEDAAAAFIGEVIQTAVAEPSQGALPSALTQQLQTLADQNNACAAVVYDWLHRRGQIPLVKDGLAMSEVSDA